MKSQLTLTKRDLTALAVSGMILLVSLGAVGTSGRRRAKEVVCLSNLFKWGVIIRASVQNHGGYFMARDYNSAWVETYIEGYGGRQGAKLLLCPDASKTYQEGRRNPHMAWGPYDYGEDGAIGSYAINLWISDNSGTYGGMSYWRTPYVQGGANAPVLLDGQHLNMEPYPTDEPPEYETDLWTPHVNEIRRACIKRHSPYSVQVLFMDFSVRKVTIKELWRLRWSRDWDMYAPLPVWPEWMADVPEP